MYNEIYKAWKAEKTCLEPQPLPGDFYQRATEYLKGLETEAASTYAQTIQGHLLKKEMETVTRLLKDLKEKRLRKIMQVVENGDRISIADFTDGERTLIENVNESLKSFKHERIAKQEHGSVAETETEFVIVRFLQGIPEIVGIDLKVYGPYEKEDIGSLPKQNAEALIKQGAAKRIEVNMQGTKKEELPINNK